MRRIALCVGAAIALTSGGALAQKFGVQSPGPLSRSHQSIDGQADCVTCHLDGGEVTRDKCLRCHELVARRISAGRGFHASTRVGGRNCGTCHLEHRGRGHDVMGWATVGGERQFNHDLAGWPLRGKHAVSACSDCHKRKSKAGLRLYVGDKKECLACHSREQTHGFDRSSGSDCAQCHGQASWSPATTARFDHDRETDFDLEGVHAEVICAKCHPKNKFDLGDKKFECTDCHKSAHEGHLFDKRKCTWCHSAAFSTFGKVRFDHRRRAKFALQGRHAKTSCYKCHRPGVARPPVRTCQGCHAGQSRHGKRFDAYGSPPDCQVCHPTSSHWRPPVFNHAQRTDFELTGKHARIGCRKCHRGKRQDEFERFEVGKEPECLSCHQHEKAHDGEFGNDRCLECHKRAGVVTPTREAREKFHGEDSRFPLERAHERVGCDACHKDDQWKGLSANCGPACHQDSLHRGSLGDDCIVCHSPGIWDALRFDHNRRSRFKLVGFHRDVDCSDCHPDRVFKPRPDRCSGCHADDDAHGGKLGDDCARCHQETGKLIFDHNRQAQFKLENRHATAPCPSCHRSLEFVPTPVRCAGCHPEPAVHRGRYGTDCENCHNTRSFADTTGTSVHDLGNFELAGAHDAVPCARCHPGGRRLGGTGQLCVRCHREDDIHANSLGPRCGDCHTQWSFAPARFDHLTVGCNLVGRHRVMPCNDCHKAGNYGALTSQCYGCHRDDVVGDGIHTGSAFFRCGDCHNANFWERPNEVPSMTDSVCR